MSDWITDRRPTAADEDKNGEVLMRRFPDGRMATVGDAYALVAAAHVGPGVPWKHTHIWKPKPLLAVGQTWRRRDDKVVTITDYNTDHRYGSTHPFRTSRGWCYTREGAWNLDGKPESPCDLVKLLSNAPAEPVAHLPGYHGDWIDASVASPTAADGDEDGDVFVCGPCGSTSDYRHWSRVGRREVWQPRAAFDKRPRRPRRPSA